MFCLGIPSELRMRTFNVKLTFLIHVRTPIQEGSYFWRGAKIRMCSMVDIPSTTFVEESTMTAVKITEIRDESVLNLYKGVINKSWETRPCIVHLLLPERQFFFPTHPRCRFRHNSNAILATATSKPPDVALRNADAS